MTDAIYGAPGNAGGDLAIDPGVTMQIQMASMVLGPVLAEPGIRDSLRDATAAALLDAGVKAVTLHLRFADGDERGKITLEPAELAEVFISRIAAEFGFTIPDYLTLAEAAG